LAATPDQALFPRLQSVLAAILDARFDPACDLALSVGFSQAVGKVDVATANVRSETLLPSDLGALRDHGHRVEQASGCRSQPSDASEHRIANRAGTISVPAARDSVTKNGLPAVRA